MKPKEYYPDHDQEGLNRNIKFFIILVVVFVVFVAIAFVLNGARLPVSSNPFEPVEPHMHP